MDEFDCCEYIKKCAEFPLQPAPPISIRQFLMLELHILECKECYLLASATAKKYVKYDVGIKFNQN